jgi:hypothetical protein
MPLMSYLTGQDSQQITYHIDPDPLLLGGQKMEDSPQMADREAGRLRQLPMDSGKWQASEPIQASQRGKWIFSKAGQDRFINRAVSTLCRFEWDRLSLRRKSRVPNMFGHSGVGHRLFPERAQKVFMDSIKSHPLYVEIEENSLLVHRKTETKRAG